jgi:hypothetical protein
MISYWHLSNLNIDLDMMNLLIDAENKMLTFETRKSMDREGRPLPYRKISFVWNDDTQSYEEIIN